MSTLPLSYLVEETSLPRPIYYTWEQLASLDRSLIPHHVAFIPDGNRRWARKRFFSAERGHKEGADRLMDVVKASKELGIKVVTFYVMSTENWSRSSFEVQAILWLLDTYLTEQGPVMRQDGVRLHTIGDLSRLPSYVQETIQRTKDITSSGKDIDLVLAINYGGRDEIRRAVSALLDDYRNQEIKKEDVTEALISRYLDTARWPDPELLIRTSGEYRISNFLLWQTSYTETYMAHVLWPDFTSQNLFEALVDFQKRDRRRGGP